MIDDIPRDARTLPWRPAYQATRAITLRQFGMGRPDLGGWIARIIGMHPRFGLDRQFLGKVYPIVFEKKPAVAFDFADVVVGDVLEVRGFESRSTPHSTFWLVQALSNEGVTLATMDGAEVAQYARARGVARGVESE